MNQQVEKITEAMGSLFLNSASIILSVTAVLKLISASGRAQVLNHGDPLIGLQFRILLISVAGLELFVAFSCYFCKNRLLASSLVLWLSAMFLTYRIGLVLIGWHGLCPCLGNITDEIPISGNILNLASECILGYLTVGSMLCLYFMRRRGEI